MSNTRRFYTDKDQKRIAGQIKTAQAALRNALEVSEAVFKSIIEANALQGNWVGPPMAEANRKLSEALDDLEQAAEKNAKRPGD
ncbi:hypothetical protein GS636_06670 [Ruegeria sp. HKCCD4884]|uniref:hypothetical protein n=1 Tax=Ruegeria sp. HKCCD4884 TaxID=2683022 RepID=UPI0014925DB2|nr:hypothetical protein [Ruegeria sp. HKCCD4884]NOD92464.1 hypothetical protein [Ruegeria sp. HKCCD4884]